MGRRITFEEWMRQVDAVLIARCGLDNSDLPDWDYMSAFEDGACPRGAARRAIRAANGEDD
jgi:hypothetical protein